MKAILLLLVSCLLSTFGFAQEPAATETKKIPNLVACTINSSAPPITKDMADVKPTTVVNGEPINKSNDLWAPATDRVKNLRIGGWGDHYHCYLRWDLGAEEKAAQKIWLGFTLKPQAGTNPPEKVEVRLVTSGDNNPIRKGPWDPAKLHWSLAPSSEHLITLPYKEGENLIEITEVVKGWGKNPEKNLGFVLVSTTNTNTFAHVSGLTLRYQK